MPALSKLVRRYTGPGVLAVGLCVAMHQPAVSAASDRAHEEQEAAPCMRSGTEDQAECRKPMPPCPLHGGTAATGPLVLLPNGTCGMLVDGDSAQDSRQTSVRSAKEYKR